MTPRVSTVPCSCLLPSQGKGGGPPKDSDRSGQGSRRNQVCAGCRSGCTVQPASPALLPNTPMCWAPLHPCHPATSTLAPSAPPRLLQVRSDVAAISGAEGSAADKVEQDADISVPKKDGGGKGKGAYANSTRAYVERWCPAGQTGWREPPQATSHVAPLPGTSSSDLGLSPPPTACHHTPLLIR